MRSDLTWGPCENLPHLIHRPVGAHVGRSRAQLLALPDAELRRIQLKHHLALATVRDGQPDVAQIATLLNAVYLAFYLEPGEPGPCRRAEAAVHDCIARGDRGGPVRLTDLERAAIEHVLTRLDAHLATVPMHRYLAAFEQLQRTTLAAAASRRSPISPESAAG
ncbi:hypothetical protein D9M68_138100 [compost metagenome]